MMIKDLGNLTSLKKAPLYPEGFDPERREGVGAEIRTSSWGCRSPGSTNGTRPTGIGSDHSLRSCPRKRASSSKTWVPAFAGTSGVRSVRIVSGSN